MATRFTDGTQAYGSGVITIDGVDYIVVSFTPDDPSTEVIDNDRYGQPSRRRVTKGLRGYSAELQLEASNTALPAFGETFSYTCDSNYGSETWTVDSVTSAQSNDASAMRTVNISGKKVMNSITTV